MKRVGVVAGLGSETSATFYLNLSKAVRAKAGMQPDVVMENIPVSLVAENCMINGDESKEHKQLLLRAVANLSRTNPDFIVIPCNTVHVFLDALQQASTAPILSILDACALACNASGFRRIGLLATEKTVKEKLFQKRLQPFSIGVLTPNSIAQRELNAIILRICAGKARAKDKDFLLKSMGRLQSQGAEAILLGCTDLSQLISQQDASLPVLDSLKILEDATVQRLLG